VNGLLDKLYASLSASHGSGADFACDFQPHEQFIEVSVSYVVELVFQSVKEVIVSHIALLGQDFQQNKMGWPSLPRFHCRHRLFS
jgi:hypothetical protein